VTILGGIGLVPRARCLFGSRGVNKQRCQEQEVLLASKQEEIKEQVRKFDKFLKDNDAKRVRADRKVQEEKKSREQKENERLELSETQRITDEQRLKLKLEVEAKGKFQRFLDSVVEELPEYFEGIENIMLRYDTLAAAHQDLGERVNAASYQHEEQSAQLQSYVKQRTNDLLVYNSEISTQQQQCDVLRYKIQDAEADLYGRYDASKEGTRSIGEIKMAIENIYARCQKGRSPGPGEPRDMTGFLAKELQALEFIQQKVTDLQSITASAHPSMIERKGQPASPSTDPAARGSRTSDGAKASIVNAGSGGGASTAPGAEKGSLRASMRPDGAAHGSTNGSQTGAGASTTSVGGRPPIT